MNGPALTEKVLVVIGGTSGMGLSAAAAFSARGAKVVAVGRDDEHLEDAQRILGDSAVVFAAEATDSSAASRAIDVSQQRFGGFHGLYHVAGGS
jgi:NADP-dependent 3-hydroxy acid dehydrogenase YdfG